MPYITYSRRPGSIGVGRSATNASYKTDTLGDWVAEVDEVVEGEVEVSRAAYDTQVAVNALHNSALPPPAPPVADPPEPSVSGRLAALEAQIAALQGRP